MSLFNNQEPKNKLVKYGILGGFFEVLYILILILSGNALTSKYLSQIKGEEILMPMLFLVVFVFSVAVSALFVLGYPAYLFFVEKKLKESLVTIGVTLLTMFVLGVALFVLIISV